MQGLASRNVEFAYQAARPALRGISVEFAPSAVTAVVGPNGAGKSTLLRLLLGTLTPAEGTVTLGGREVRSLKAAERAARVAYIPQTPTLSEDFTARQVVQLGRYARGRSGAAVEHAIKIVGLENMADESFASLSAGQRQRVTLARALAQLAGQSKSAPVPADQVLLADEPCSAMDPRHAMHAMGVLRSQARAGVTVVVVLHDFPTALRFADRAVLLDASGRLRAHETTDRALTAERLSGVFGVGFVREEALLPAATVT